MIENSIDDFSARFHALHNEAKMHGLRGVSILVDDDPISGEESKLLVWRGGYSGALGLIEWAKHQLLNDPPTKRPIEE